MSSGIEELRNELEACRQEVPEMEKLLKQIGDILDRKIATGDVVKKLEQQQKQLKKDIANYEHMLEEADDLRKSWEKDETMMANINQNRRFDEGANTFELPIRDLKEMQEKEVAPAKMKEDRVKFTRYDGGGGEIKDLPIVFEFGLLKKHNMGGWEQNSEQSDDDHFSFTFRWDEENYDDRDVLDELRIKATSIVILYDEVTSTIVNFDVEPGFEHQWGYGRQRFLLQSTLRENSNRVKAKAIIKEWSQQHEYELGKYAIELLRQSKASRNEISQTIQFIVDQANSASEWTQEKVTLEHKITELEATIKVLRETKLKLTEEKDTASAEIERLKAELEVKKSEIVAKNEEIEKIKAELAESQMQASLNPMQFDTQMQVGSEQAFGSTMQQSESGDTGSTQVGRDPRVQIKQLEDDLAEKIKELEELQKKVDEELKPDIEGKAAEIEKLNADAAKAVEAIQQLDADKKELEEKINELEKNIQKLAALVKSQGDENNKLTEDLKAAQDALEAQKNECKEEKSALQASINEKEKQVEEEQTKNAELATKVTTLEEEVLTYKKKVQIVAKKHNACRDQLIKANEDLKMAKNNAAEAIKLLQPIADLSEIEVPAAEEFEEVTITAEEEATLNKKKVTVETTTPKDPEPEPEPAVEPAPAPAEDEKAIVEEVKPVEEPVIEAENINDGDNSSVSSESTIEAPIEESPVKETPLKEAPESSSSSSSANASDVEEDTKTPSNVTVVENDGEGFDGIIADKVERTKTPEFFPPKKEPQSEEMQPEKVSQKTSRSNSITSEQKKARKGSKSLAKFDLSMGVKKEKKESGLSKFFKACTGGGSKKKTTENISDAPKSDPQMNPPSSP